jgi:capsular polysaccharide biosynthesis protein
LTATLVAANQAGGLVVVDPPFRPMRPITGGRSKVAIGGGIGALVLALAVMVLAAMMDRRIYGAEDVSRVIPATLLVVVPRLEAGKSE